LAYAHTRIHTCTHTYEYVGMYTWRAFTSTHRRIRTCTHTQAHTRIHTYTRTRAYVCIYSCNTVTSLLQPGTLPSSAQTYKTHTHTNIQTHIHTHIYTSWHTHTHMHTHTHISHVPSYRPGHALPASFKDACNNGKGAVILAAIKTWHCRSYVCVCVCMLCMCMCNRVRARTKGCLRLVGFVKLCLFCKRAL